MKFLVTPLTTFFEKILGIVEQMGVTDPSLKYFLGILLFTLIIKMILLPLTIKQTKSTARMGEMQPKIKELQAKYKNDPVKLQKAQMELQKEMGVNPAAGCLLMLVQFPIMIGMYWVVYNFKGFEAASFLWIKSLGESDKTFILPIISAVTQYLSGILMITNPDDPQAKQQKTMSLYMSIMFVVMLSKAKSALWLYWTISNLIQMAQQVFIIRTIKGKEQKKLA